MFIFEDPSDLEGDWYLGDKNKFTERIPNKLLKSISNAHIIGIQFLFENFVKKRGGAVLNQEEDFNMPLQVCAFLSSVENKIDKYSPVLIIASECSYCKWHYHATEAGFEPKVITTEDFETSNVLIVDPESLKLAKNIFNINAFCVVIEDFDEVATKQFVRKLKGSFNIGLTKRNFYKNPDPKLRWTMLNWASPGCVGKLGDFYRIDRLHSLAFADNYRFWWLRLTWKFCESFEQPSEEHLEDYQRKLSEWAEHHTIKVSYKAKQGVKRIKCKKEKSEQKKIKLELDTASSSISREDGNSQQNLEVETAKTEIDSDVIQSGEPEVANFSNENLETFKQASETFSSQDILYPELVSIKNEENDNTSNISAKEYHSDENSFSFLFDEEAAKDKGLSDLEGNIEEDSDDNSFFKEFILGKKSP